jgi:hypothetical protein
MWVEHIYFRGCLACPDRTWLLVKGFRGLTHKTFIISTVATIRKVAGPRRNEVNEFFQFDESFQPHYALGFIQPLTEMSTRGRKIMFLGNRARPVYRVDSLTAICESTV